MTSGERLWTPWRLNYIQGDAGTGSDAAGEQGCVFCTAAALSVTAGRDEHDVGHLVVYRGQHALLMLNLYPYATGHCMAVPYRHVSNLGDLAPDERAELMELATLAVDALTLAYRPHGFNVGFNLGSVAGAGIAQHLHLHIVPRWGGDSNFMPVLADTRVIPELLPVTYARLRAEIERVVVERAGQIAQAGAVVLLPRTRQVVLRRGKSGNVVLPKGHIDPGEHMAQTALRETQEETGIRASIVGWAGSHSFDWDDGVRHVAFFAALADGTGDLAAHLGEDVVLTDPDAAADLLDYPDLQAIVSAAIPRLLAAVGEDA